MTDRDYGDFELLFEWKIAAGGNSGIKYRVRSFDGRMLGCEYQMIDDRPGPGTSAKSVDRSSLRSVRPCRASGTVSGGEFNRGRILVQGDRIEHWLNGRLIVSAQVGSPSVARADRRQQIRSA